MSLKIQDLRFAYGSHAVLKGVSFDAAPGDFVSVLGPNGVGKSTLFRCMLGLLHPTGGTVTVDGRDIAAMTAAELSRTMAYIPQSHNHVFNFSVFDMVLMGTTAQLGRFATPGRQQEALAEAALDRMGIRHLRDRGFSRISGGERQLVLLARAIAQQARILVMDEPSANLDFGNKLRVMKTVKGLTADGYTVIQSTHDPDQAYLYSDKILALHAGTVLAFGAPADVMTTELISRLYNVDVELCSMHDDAVRVCVPANIRK